MNLIQKRNKNFTAKISKNPPYTCLKYYLFFSSSIFAYICCWTPTRFHEYSVAEFFVPSTFFFISCMCVCVRVLISCSFLMQDLTYSYGLIVIAQFIQRFKYASKRSSLCSHFDLHLLAGFCTASPPTSLSHLILFSFLFWTSGLHLTLKYCFILRPKRSTNRIICAIDDRSILIAMNKQNTYYNAELSFLPEWMNGYFESLIW